MFFLSLQGSWYDIGFKHGEELKSLVKSAVEKRFNHLQEEQMPSQNKLMEKAKIMKKEFPELMEEIKGIADGAECSLDDILFYNLSPFLESCSNLVFLCDEGPMLGHVNDDVSKGEFDVAFHLRLSDGREILHIGMAGSAGTAAAINSDGLSISHACARSGGLQNSKEVLNLPLFRRSLIQRNHTYKEAESFLMEHSFNSGADNIICVDKTGGAFVAEKLPTAVEFRYPTKKAIYCTGRVITSKIKKLTGQDNYEVGNVPVQEMINRERYLETIISKQSGGFSFDIMKDTLRCEDEGIWNELSNWTAILIPSRFEMLVATRFPDSSEFVRIDKIQGK